MNHGEGSLAGLAKLRDFESHRLSSYDRAGGNFDNLVIPPGESVTLGKIEGAGCVKHIWMTMMSIPEEEHDLCQTVLRCHWDGEVSPSVEVPLGDFFGVGFGLRRNFSSLPLQMSPQDGKGMNCWFPMPFSNGARFEVENQGQRARLLYYYIDYEAYAELDEDLARFHASWRRRNPSVGTAQAKGYARSDYYPDVSSAGPGFGLERPDLKSGRWKMWSGPASIR